ncbi:MAG TPA: hypothetical protein VI636_04630 [Candidatus Angelobacter sp.]
MKNLLGKSHNNLFGAWRGLALVPFSFFSGPDCAMEPLKIQENFVFVLKTKTPVRN